MSTDDRTHDPLNLGPRLEEEDRRLRLLLREPRPPTYQVDSHLRHSFGPPPTPPRPPRGPWPRRLRAWFYRQEIRLGGWLARRLSGRLHPDQRTEQLALHLLILGMLVVILAQALLLVLATPR